jgi:fimbrial chaperone protein
VRLGPPASGSDVSFRLVVDELPTDESQGQAQVSVRMRYVLPLFLRAEDAIEPRLSCGLEAGPILTCINAGGQAAQLGASLLTDDSSGAVRLSTGLFGYVLPGSRRVWALPEDSAAFAAKAQEVRLETQLNGQPATLPLQ